MHYVHVNPLPATHVAGTQLRYPTLALEEANGEFALARVH